MCRQSATVCLVKSVPPKTVSGLGLADRPGQAVGSAPSPWPTPSVRVGVADRGVRRHGAPVVRGSAQQDTLARLGARLLTPLNVRLAPSAATVRRIIAAVCPGGLADLTGSDPAGAESVAADQQLRQDQRTLQQPWAA